MGETVKQSGGVSTAALALHFGVSREEIRRLVSAGVLQKHADQTFDIDACRLAYIKHLRDKPTRVAARDRLTAAQTRLVEQRHAEREGRLVPASELKFFASTFAGKVRSEHAGFAARCFPHDLTGRQIVDRQVTAMDNRLADAMEALAAELEAKRSDRD